MPVRPLTLFALTGLMVVSACQGRSTQAPPPVERTDLQATRRVLLTAAVVSAAKIRTALVTRECLGGAIELPGEIASDPDRTARVSSPIAGRVESVALRLGARVEKGDLLLSLRVPDLSRLRADITSKEAMSRVAQANAARTASLADLGVASTKEAARATAEATSLDAQARSAAEVMRALGSSPGIGVENSVLTLRAPMAGMVIARNAIVGQPVLAEQPLGTIADLRQVWFLARVYEGDVAHVHIDARATVLLNAYPDQKWGGTISYLDEQVDPMTRAMTARVVLDNSKGLLHLGLFGVARISTTACGGPSAPLVIPEGALTDLDGKPTAFVLVGDGAFEPREVTPGAVALGKVEILSGLHDGEKVVVDGAFTLKSVLLRGALGED